MSGSRATIWLIATTMFLSMGVVVQLLLDCLNRPLSR
jgi:hypothetical protein